jgi:hypothetical protein
MFMLIYHSRSKDMLSEVNFDLFRIFEWSYAIFFKLIPVTRNHLSSPFPAFFLDLTLFHICINLGVTFS